MSKKEPNPYIQKQQIVHIDFFICGLLIACNATICKIPPYICSTKIDNMKKIATQFLALLLMVSVSASSSLAASVPVSVPSSTQPATEPSTQPAAEPAAAVSSTKSEPSSEEVKSALDEFKNLSHKEKKSRMKEAKKLFKEYRAAKKARSDDDAKLILLAILAILLPPLAVYLKEEAFDVKFWISLVLMLLVFFTFVLWLVPAIYALLVVFDVL